MKTTAFYTPPPGGTAKPMAAGSTLGGLLASSGKRRPRSGSSSSNRAKLPLTNVLLGVESCECDLYVMVAQIAPQSLQSLFGFPISTLVSGYIVIGYTVFSGYTAFWLGPK